MVIDMAKTRAQENRAIRQDALRQWLSEKCTAQHIVENILKIEALSVKTLGGKDSDGIDYKNLQHRQFQLAQLKVANDQRIKLLGKYLPDLKATEITGEGGGNLTVVTMEYKPSAKDSNP